MATLSRELRRSLENTVREARRIAEAGARKVIEQLAVHHHERYTSMTPEQRELRNALRAHGRQLGDRRDATRGSQAIDRLTTECAYEHWHRMLFARFLAESNLLIEPESGMDITLQDCQELARERNEDWRELASKFAERMLPQIFRTNDPVLKVALPPETRSELENLLKALPRDVFIAEDSLGWVYQYWQADKKDEVNRSEKKIGADELPAVTQLFTEDYMVFFLLHNTLGAWWAGKVLAGKPELAADAKSEEELRAACSVGGIEWTYLRFVREGDGPWRPAAGCFEGWPKSARDITVLDPCMGSGHFLVFALPMLAALRAEEEGLSVDAAIKAVLHDNLFGLEIDPRCTQIAAFNLALAAWRRVGYQPLPALHLACSGLSLGVTKVEWLRLAERVAAALPVPPKTDLLGTEDNLFSDAMKRGFERLYDIFARGPWLGSLIDPRGAGGDLIEQSFADLEPILTQVMAKTDSADLSEMAVAAQGLAKAADVLSGRFTLVTTNVPYLGRKKQGEQIREFCENHYPESKADLATCFMERCLTFSASGGCVTLVLPQNVLFLGTFKKLREKLLRSVTWNTVVRLGEHGFESTAAAGAFTAFINLELVGPGKDHSLVGIDVSAQRGEKPIYSDEKASLLTTRVPIVFKQEGLLSNADATIVFGGVSDLPLLSLNADSYQGSGLADIVVFRHLFWEIQSFGNTWVLHQSSPDGMSMFSGMHFIARWEGGQGELVRLPEARIQGRKAWDRMGVACAWLGRLPVGLYLGTLFDNSAAAIIPKRPDDLPAIWSFLSSPEFPREVRKINQKTQVANATLVKVPFDLDYWHDVATKKYPHGLPVPHSDDLTQWLFNGHPKGAESPLAVAVARLVGYRWPRQTGSSLPRCSAVQPDGLEKHADRDGIVTLSPVKGEQPGVGRLTALLADAWGAEWSAAKLNSMLVQVGYASKTLDDWLRDGFFEQHCALFHQRPFVWHIWDGRRDGFHALVNYHRLAAPNGEGRRTLEKVLYTYLGDWIDRQRADQKMGVEGTDARLAAAEHLKAELVNILAGEPPYDIFVRWKSLDEQPIGWEPDINDGVWINIRPFMTAKPLGARPKGACILRITPQVKWDKGRGKEPQRPKEDFPWFWGWDEAAADFPGGKTFDGNRWNDLHYTRVFKETARERRKGAK